MTQTLSTGKEVILILKNCWGREIQTMFLDALAEEGMVGVGEGGNFNKTLLFSF